MTDEEKAESYTYKHLPKGLFDFELFKKMKEVIIKAYLDGIAEGRKETTEKILVLEKENEALKEQISTLLSCKSCPENKGGYICEKEYNDKCLAQKIEYIKELKEEIANLQKYIETLSENYENEIAEHKKVIINARIRFARGER